MSTRAILAVTNEAVNEWNIRIQEMNDEETYPLYSVDRLCEVDDPNDHLKNIRGNTSQLQQRRMPTSPIKPEAERHLHTVAVSRQSRRTYQQQKGANPCNISICNQGENSR